MRIQARKATFAEHWHYGSLQGYVHELTRGQHCVSNALVEWPRNYNPRSHTWYKPSIPKTSYSTTLNQNQAGFSARITFPMRPTTNPARNTRGTGL